MSPKQAQQQISDIFSRSFDRERYSAFLANLLNKVEPRDGHYTGNYVPEAYREHINQYWRIGKYTDPEGEELDLLVVEVKSLAKLDRARSALRNFAINRLKQFEKEASLIAFYASDDGGADWRFSFVKIEHEAFKDEKGKVKLKEQLTPAKRYSYLVGENENSHTACKQLLPVLAMDYADPRVEEIEAAFSIEKVTDEFFEQYKALFQKLAEHLKREPWFQRESEVEQDQLVTRFAKKLLGQIVFLYFLQKKGWLGAGKDQPYGTGPKNFMRQRFDAKTEGQNFYADCLQYLFYEALADERKGQKDPGYYERFDCRLPFLNGGLFEADYDWRNESITIPDALFHNSEKTKAGDIGTGILDVFDRYNFTIKEDEPLDKEVAVDPEMLGKVFENMLEVTERKSKGAFYTPREIVHYMCQESLIHYLEKTVGPDSDAAIPRADLEWLIRKGHLALENDQRVLNAGRETATYSFTSPDSIRQQAALIDTALADIKVCDPAIGSGAFPVGMLHEIVHAREVLGVLGATPRRTYDLKKHAIGNSIYGVDIDPSAIDIARLRLWLSLIVDEDDYATIDALPNLDYKIMQGNSLIEEFEGVKLFDDAFIQDETSDPLAEEKTKLEQCRIEIQREYMEGLQNGELFDARRAELDVELKEINTALIKIDKTEKKAAKDALKKGDPLFELVSEARKKAKQLEARQQEFFDASSSERKRQLREEITRLEWELIEATLKEQGKTDALAKLENFKTSGEKPYFLWKLNFSEVFRQKGGFDVVIGNPPYVQIQSMSGQSIQKDLEAQRYETFAKTGDLYCLFYERGHRVLHEDGNLCFITSNKWMRAAYGEKIRNFFSRQTQPLILIDFSSFQVFATATVDTNVLLFRKRSGNEALQACLIDPSFKRETPLAAFVAKKAVMLDDLSGESWTISSKAEYEIKKQIEKVGIPLKDWDVSIYRGILTGFNEAFIIDGKKKDELIAADPKSAEIIKPVLRGRDIKRYRIDFADLWLINTHNGYGNVPAIDVTQYPAIKMHLDQYLPKLKKRQDKGKTPYNLRNCAYENDFRKEKIIYPDIMRLARGSTNFSDFPYMYLDLYGYYPEATNFILTGKNVKTVLAVLTSELGIYAFITFYSGPIFDNKGFRYKKAYLENLPIIRADNRQLNELITYAHIAKILGRKLEGAYLNILIDGLVYELYFPEEIAAAGKQILPHLGELTPIDDTMSEAEKLPIIQREFDRLYDPSHPVRNHLETLDSVPVVKTIREALKR
jgi:hypothetical protein